MRTSDVRTLIVKEVGAVQEAMNYKLELLDISEIRLKIYAIWEKYLKRENMKV